jgi:DNA-binding NarL/FixJ family response regulator
MPRVLIADDYAPLRDALKTVLFSRRSWVICGEAADGAQAVDMASALKPDLVLLDFLMPKINGLQAAEQILRTHPTVPIVLYTLHKHQLLESKAKALGVRRVIAKGDIFCELIASLEELFGPALSPVGPRENI